MTRPFFVTWILFHFLACGAPVSAGQTRVTLALQWLPQAQFTGYYIAQDQGFYQEEGLDVTILPGGPGKGPALSLETGKADFATLFLSTAASRHQAGIPLVNIAQLIQHSSILIIARADSGIRHLADFHHKKITMWDNEFLVQPLALFRQNKIKVIRIPLGDSMELFIRNAVAGTMAMWYNEYHTLLSSGFRESELITFFMKDTDFDFPEDGIYCRRQLVETKPETTQAFVRASLKGWRYAFSHQNKALDSVRRRMEAMNLPFSQSHQMWMLKRIQELMLFENTSHPMGKLDKKVFERMMTTLNQAGFIQGTPAFETFYRDFSNED